MSTYKAPLDDLRFALYDVLGVEERFARLGFADANRELVDAVLDEAARFTETVLAPLNRIGDEVGCTYDKATGDVTPPPGFKQAFQQFVEGGWTGLAAVPVTVYVQGPAAGWLSDAQPANSAAPPARARVRMRRITR